MPGGRSRHQLIPLPRHFHLSGLTACITHPQGRVVCICECVFFCACVSWLEKGRKTHRDEWNYVRGRETDTGRNFTGRPGGCGISN